MTLRHCLFLLAAAGVSCSDTTNTAGSLLYLDRPVDVAFACYGGLRITNGQPASTDQEVTVAAQPTEACVIRSGVQTGTTGPVPFGQEDLFSMGGTSVAGVSWFGLILQRGPGTVAVATWPTKPAAAPEIPGVVAAQPGVSSGEVGMQDTDILTPGINAVSVGEDPVAIVTDRLGCHAITANAGSGDLSVLDIASVVDRDPSSRVDRLTVKNASGARIDAKPAAMVVEPNAGTIGNRCPETAVGTVFIAYPSCHLVAAVDVSTGTITRGIQYSAAGVPALVDGNVDPATCFGNMLPTPGPRPVTLALERDDISGTRLVIGSDNSASFAVVELDADAKALSVSQIALEKTSPDMGITDIALSSTVGFGGETGMFTDEGPGGSFQFVYAIATDHSVRVADILSLNTECDTQIDPRALRSESSIRKLGCLPIGDPLLPRRATANGPGIRFSTPTIDRVPLSVAIVKSVVSATLASGPGHLVGHFATVSTASTNPTASNDVFVINIDDDDYADLFDQGHPLAAPISNTIAHQIRENVIDRGALAEISVPDNVDDPGAGSHLEPLCNVSGPTTDSTTTIGGPRSSNVPLRNYSTTNIAPEKLTQLPYFRQFSCTGNDTTSGPLAITELSYAASEQVRDHEFPDLRALAPDDTWTLSWEGSISLDSADSDVDGPGVRESQMYVDGAGIHLTDQTKPYCNAGVEPYDIVQLRGCDPSVGDDDCPKNYRCYVHPESQIAGLGACILAEEADRLAVACKDFLTSQRRYTVRTASSGELILAPRRRELKTSPIDGCVSDTQCEMLADYAARTTSAAQPAVDQTATDDHTWACVADSSRAPIPPNNKRCVLKCDTSDDCTSGSVCAGAVEGQAMSGFCMEGVTPPQSCLNAPQRYELRAGEAFTVVGTASGFVHATIADPATGQCVRKPGASPYLTGRLKLNPPACNPAADPLSGRLPDGTFDANPCSTTTATTDVTPIYTDPATCTRPDSGDPQVMLVERPAAPAIVFRNPALNLTLVDPYYPGDQSCILDRKGALGKIPLVFNGYQLAFRQVAGFSALRVPVGPAYPVKVLRGPLDSLWVVDEGDHLATQLGDLNTRGRVFRIEPSKMSDPATLQ